MVRVSNVRIMVVLVREERGDVGGEGLGFYQDYGRRNGNIGELRLLVEVRIVDNLEQSRKSVNGDLGKLCQGGWEQRE